MCGERCVVVEDEEVPGGFACRWSGLSGRVRAGGILWTRVSRYDITVARNDLTWGQ